MKKHFAAALVALGISGIAAQSAVAGGAVDYRESVMTIYKWYLKPMKGMATGKMAFDKAAFRKNAEGLATAAQLDLLAGFPEGSMDEDSRAKEKIWKKWSDFEGKFEAFQREAAKLAQVAKEGDEAAMKQQFAATGKTCGGCHKQFRSKK